MQMFHIKHPDSYKVNDPYKYQIDMIVTQIYQIK